MAVGLASNAVRTIKPVGRVIDLAHAVGALVYVDAVHAAPLLSLDVTAAHGHVRLPELAFGRMFGGAGDSRTRRERLAAAMHVIRDAERDLASRALAALGNVPGYGEIDRLVQVLGELG